MRPSPLGLLLASPLLFGLVACDRPAQGRAGAASTATATAPAPAASVASPATVALSGAIRDLPVGTTPDAAPTTAPAAPSTVPMPPATPAAATPLPETAETEAMREFREAQERRDRELLERDLDAVRNDRVGQAEDDAWDERSAGDETWRDDAPPADDAPPPDDELPSDDDLRWDPATGTWR